MKIEMQLTCEELGGQPAIKLSLKRGQPVCKITVPVMNSDTLEQREAKVAAAVERAKQFASVHNA